jgi:uncharacterized protein YqeY
MSLKDTINTHIKESMKSGDKVRLETVRSIKKDILEKETAAGRTTSGDLTPEEEIALLTTMAKRRRDSIEQFVAAGRADLAASEEAELKIIQQYLPAQLSEADVRAVIDRIITSVGATSAKDSGKVMGPAMKELKGKADGSLVQKIVKEKLP